jgi:hypothetical protein
MRGTLGGLYCRRNLSVRGSEEADDLLGQRLVAGQPGELVLPKVEVASGQPVEIPVGAGLGIIAVARHGATIAQACLNRRSQPQTPPCRTAASALRFARLCKRAFTIVPVPEEREA